MCRFVGSSSIRVVYGPHKRARCGPRAHGSLLMTASTMISCARCARHGAGWWLFPILVLQSFRAAVEREAAARARTQRSVEDALDEEREREEAERTPPPPPPTPPPPPPPSPRFVPLVIEEGLHIRFQDPVSELNV